MQPRGEVGILLFTLLAPDTIRRLGGQGCHEPSAALAGALPSAEDVNEMQCNGSSAREVEKVFPASLNENRIGLAVNRRKQQKGVPQ